MEVTTIYGWVVVVLSFPGRKVRKPHVWVGGLFTTRGELIEAWDTTGPGLAFAPTMRWARARRAGHVMACHAFAHVADCRLTRRLAAIQPE